jgi:hypothetical protein
MTRLSFPLLLGFLLAGCAQERASYPSLAPRAVEKLGFGEPETAPLVATADPELDARIKDEGATLDRVVAGFDRDAAVAIRGAAAAKGKPVGSEAWLTAQTQLATLDDWRAQLSAAATEIEQLALDRAAALQPVYPALDALQERARAEAERQDTTIRRIQGSLPAA